MMVCWVIRVSLIRSNARWLLRPTALNGSILDYAARVDNILYGTGLIAEYFPFNGKAN